MTEEQQAAIYSFYRWWNSEKTIQGLEYLAARYPAAFWAFVAQYGEGRLSLQLLNDYTAIAACDETMAVGMLDMLLPTDATAYSYLSSRAVTTLAGLARTDRMGLQALASHPDFPQPLAPEDRLHVVLLALEQAAPEAASALRGLNWVQEALIRTRTVPTYTSYWPPPRSYQETSVLHLEEMGRVAGKAFWAIMDEPWVNDGYGTVEFSMISDILAISRWHEDSALRLLEMPFLDAAEHQIQVAKIVGILERVRSLEPWGSVSGADVTSLERFLSSPELGGVITNDTLGLAALVELRGRNPDAWDSINALPWVADGIAPLEQHAVIELRNMAIRGGSFYSALLKKAWIQDGVSQREFPYLESLRQFRSRYLGGRSEEDLEKILEMPYLDEIDDLDFVVMRALDAWQQRGTFTDMLNRPELNGGITDENAHIFLTLRMANAEYNSLHYDTILDPTRTVVNRRMITLPKRGEVHLSVVWPGRDASEVRAAITMDILEGVIRVTEDFMGIPFPKDHVVVVVSGFDERLVFSDRDNAVFGIERHRYTGTSLIAFEIAHTYWRDMPTWIEEGASTVLERIVKRSVGGAVVPQDSHSCGVTNNLAEFLRMERQDPLRFGASGCHYILGRGMFHRLYDALGEDLFRQRLSVLYARFQDEVLSDSCPGIDAGVCHMKAAFVDSVEGDDADRADAIINSWYYGRSP